MSEHERLLAEPSAPRLYGRRKGRPLRVRKAGLMGTLLPSLQIELPAAGQHIAPASWFGDGCDAVSQKPQEVWLEIGFGGGEHLAAQAACHPHIAMIGCEPFANGVASLLDHIDRQALHNIRIYNGDARLLLAALPDGCLARVYILFADPWPKKRHAERRFVQQDSLAAVARVLQPHGLLTLATDDPTLQEWTTTQLNTTPHFMPINGSGISPDRPAEWVNTRYEDKALIACRTPLYYQFQRKIDGQDAAD